MWIRTRCNRDILQKKILSFFTLNQFFLDLNFRRVLIVVSFLLGKSPASVYYCIVAYNNTLTPGTYPKEKKLQPVLAFWTSYVFINNVQEITEGSKQ